MGEQAAVERAGTAVGQCSAAQARTGGQGRYAAARQAGSTGRCHRCSPAMECKAA
ncbi:hypothetical protein GUV64_10240 [Stenotrophomonas maltophilia]|nr:hypothetical protein [Stenotrophomonas maltophilia]